VIVGQLRDLAGNKTAKVFTTVSLKANGGAIVDKNVVADSAVTVDTRTVQFAIDKPLKTIDAKDFTVDSKAVEFAKYENKTLKDGKTYGAVITLQVAETDMWNTDATPSVLTTDAPKSESQYGDKFGAKATLVAKVADAVAPALADVNNDKTVNAKDLELKKDAKGNVESVTVSFTEALKQSTLSVEDFEVPGYAVADVKLVNDSKALVVLSPAAEQGTSFKVRFVGSVSDLNSNAFVGNGFEFTVGAEENPVNSAPTAADVKVAGKAQVGQELTGSYSYADADSDKEGASTFKWYADGVEIAGATGKTYTLTAAEVGKKIEFEVTPVASTGSVTGKAVKSAQTDAVTAAPVKNEAPTATDVKVTGTAQEDQELTGSYSYADTESDAEGTSTFKWYADGVEIAGATSKTYTLTAAEVGKKIQFEVTPVAGTGTQAGNPVKSTETTAVLAK